MFGVLFSRRTLCLAIGGCLLAAKAGADDVRFNRDIRPILSENCFACHGPDKKARKAELRLDAREGLFGKDQNGAVLIAPGDPRAGELYRRITSTAPDERMPPTDSGHALTPAQIDLIRRWIEQGAKWEGHWAYLPLERPRVPEVSAAGNPLRSPPAARVAESANPIDRFLRNPLAREKLQGSPQADAVTLARRLSFDLRGLPADPRETEDFARQADLTAYEKLVDRWLASPSFGERMAVHWLDLVRYGDSGGYHSDGEIFISPYRDYVIDAFNENLPFDQFTREQIAGDLLPNRTLRQRVASGYNRLNKTTEEGGAQAGEYLVKHNADRIRTTAGVWLGVTLGCCECHDHKYDPFTTADFYALSAFFADIDEVGHYKPGARAPEIRVPTRVQAHRLNQIADELAGLRAQVAQRGPNLSADKQADLQKKIGVLAAETKRIEKTGVRTLITVSVKPREIRILPRGNWLDRSGPVVEPAIPVALRGAAVDARSSAIPRQESAGGRPRLSRRDLADWIVSRGNPLTARVFVNRLWKLFFGVGISKQLDNLGVQGEWPTYPELLDWLAVEFVDSGYDVKHMVRLMVTSSAYRQSSVGSDELRRRDPDNRLCARQSRWRLDAEFIRDDALAISGLLVHRLGGPSVKPYQPAGYWAYLNFPTREWHHDVGPNQYRRGLYTHWQRTFPHPSLLAFDAPAREECTAQRPVSNTPKAALALLNDPSYVEAARSFAARIVREGGRGTGRVGGAGNGEEAETDDFARMRWAWRQAVCREPDVEEARLLLELCRSSRRHFANERDAAAKLVAAGLAPVPANLDVVELASWTQVARALLNLHETITRE